MFNDIYQPVMIVAYIPINLNQIQRLKLLILLLELNIYKIVVE